MIIGWIPSITIDLYDEGYLRHAYLEQPLDVIP